MALDGEREALMIYVSAQYANAEHTMVTGWDEFGNSETVPHDYTLFRQPDDGPVGFVNNGGVIAAYIPPPPEPETEECPTCHGTGRVPLED